VKDLGHLHTQAAASCRGCAPVALDSSLSLEDLQGLQARVPPWCAPTDTVGCMAHIIYVGMYVPQLVGELSNQPKPRHSTSGKMSGLSNSTAPCGWRWCGSSKLPLLFLNYTAKISVHPNLVHPATCLQAAEGWQYGNVYQHSKCLSLQQLSATSKAVVLNNKSAS
jgi:hypothetical protein